MRKSILDRSGALDLNGISDEAEGILPLVRMKASDDRVEIQHKTLDARSYSGITINDPEVVREMRDQLDDWLERHEEDSQ